MTLKITAHAVMLAFVLMLVSCLENSQTVTYDDTSVTSFTLGQAKCVRKVYGKDSTYTFSYSASRFPVYIDQYGDTMPTITNKDNPLLFGTDMKHMLVSISTKNNGLAAFRNIEDSLFTIFNPGDSIDLSQPRTLRVLAQNGIDFKDYIVDIVAQEEDADSFTWTRLPDCPAIAAFTQMSTVATGDYIYVLGYNEASTETEKSQLLRSKDGKDWDATGCTLPSGITAAASIMTFENKLYLLDDNKLYTSIDGTTWSAPILPNLPLKTILGGYTYAPDGGSAIREVYAIAADGTFAVSDNDQTWEYDVIENSSYSDNRPFLPVSDWQTTVITSKVNKDVGNIIVIGNAKANAVPGTVVASDTTAVVWHKIADKDSKQWWTYTPVQNDNKKYILPRMESLSAAHYANGIIVIGGKKIDKNSKIYYSPDYGTTWHTVSGLTVPEDFTATASARLIADGNGYFYLIGGGTGIIYKARQNKATWKESQKYFE